MATASDDLAAPLIPIDRLDDPRVADYRDVREADLIRNRGVFIAESAVVLQALVEQHTFRICSVLLSPNRVDKLRPLLAQLDASVPVYVAPPAVMNGLVGFKIHRGVLAVGERVAAPAPAELLGSLAGSSQLVVALEGLTNHDNVGGVFRNAAAFGAAAVLLDDRCCDPLYRKAIRVSVGHVLRVPYARCQSGAAMQRELRAAGFSLVALSPRAEAADLSAFVQAAELPQRIALVLGTEGPGLPTATLDAADHLVRIPIEPGVDSLNVATTCGIALHCIRTGLRRS